MDKHELLHRTRKFAVMTFKLVSKFPNTKASGVVTYQLLKAASSVAANYRAVNRAKSRQDFSNKIKIVLEESDECNFWLTFVKDIGLIHCTNDLDYLIRESNEFISIFTSASKTLSNN